MNPGSAEQEKIKAAESRLEKSIANVKLEVRRDARGALTIVTAMDLYAYFSTLDDADRYKLYEATFGAAHRASSRVKSLALKKELVSELSHLPDPWVLGGFTYLNHSVLRVEGVAGSADCTFTKTSNGEHTGWCRGNGFSLTASKSKKEGSVWIHELAAFADPEEDLDLSTDEELLTFLNCCVPGARIGDPSAGRLPFLVEEFGALSYYGWFSQYFNRAKNLSGWSSEVAVLRDAVDEETLNTMAWLAALSDMPTAVGKIAFSLESDSEPDQPATFLLPVLANTVRASTIVWLDCNGKVLVDKVDSGILGISVEDVRTVDLNVAKKFEKRTIEPEFLFHPHLVIARGRQGFHQISSGMDYVNYPMLADLDIDIR